jgi:hypothetical protein
VDKCHGSANRWLSEADLNKAKQHVRGLQDLMTSLNADPAARARTAMDLADAQVEA